MITSVQFSRSVVSDSLWPHESQHARPPCPSPTPGVYPNLCPSSRWYPPAISSFVVPFSSCPQSLPASGSFPMSQLFAWGGQSIGVSVNISPSNEHPGLISFRMDWLDLLAVQGTLKSLLQKASIFQCSAFFTVQLSHPHMTTGKTIALTRRTFVGKVISLLFNMLFRLVITFLPRSKRLLISWLQSPSAVILEPPKIKSDTVSTVSPSISQQVITYGSPISRFTRTWSGNQEVRKVSYTVWGSVRKAGETPSWSLSSILKTGCELGLNPASRVRKQLLMKTRSPGDFPPYRWQREIVVVVRLLLLD